MSMNYEHLRRRLVRKRSKCRSCFGILPSTIWDQRKALYDGLKKSNFHSHSICMCVGDFLIVRKEDIIEYSRSENFFDALQAGSLGFFGFLTLAVGTGLFDVIIGFSPVWLLT